MNHGNDDMYKDYNLEGNNDDDDEFLWFYIVMTQCAWNQDIGRGQTNSYNDRAESNTRRHGFIDIGTYKSHINIVIYFNGFMSLPWMLGTQVLVIRKHKETTV